MAKGKQGGPIVLFLMGLIFAAAGLAVVYYLGHDTELNCRRTVNRCVIEKTNVFGDTEVEETIRLGSLAGAEVIEKRDSDGDYTYKVMLITDEGRIPLSSVSTSDRKSHRENAQKINNYVNSFNETLELVESGKWIRIFGFVFAGIGGLMFLGSLAGLLKFIVLLGVMLSGRG